MIQYDSKKAKAIWDRLTGNEQEFSPEHKAFNAIGIISLVFLTIQLPFNIIIGLVPIALLMSGLIIAQGLLYYLSRFRKKFLITVNLYAIASYITLAFTYYYNSGINGLTIFLFFLTFMLLIAFTPKKRHWLWALSHLSVAIILLTLEHTDTAWIKDSYNAASDRYLDILSSYVVTLGCIYFITIYLRDKYDYERKLSEERAKDIEKQNRKLERLNQEKTKLLSIISHDLRSPLNSIKSYFELAGAHVLDSQERLLLEHELIQLTEHTSVMLSNLLSWSKTQMDGKEANLTIVNLHDILEETFIIQSNIASNKGVNFSYDIDPISLVTADPDMLQLVLRNIISNAIKFTDVGGTVTVISKVVKDECYIIVKDNGMGIAEELQKQIFSFETQAMLGTMNEKGVGLGLVLCKEYMDVQHGRIWFDSKTGRGTTFYIALPVASYVQPLSLS